MPHTYKKCEWDEYNLYKNEIKHGVSAIEIEQCFKNISLIIPHKKYSDSRVMLGITNAGRYLFIVFQHKSKTIARPIHAKDMKPKDKETYEKQTGQIKKK